MIDLIQLGLLLATIGCLLVNAFEVIAKVRKAGFVLRNSSELGIVPDRIPYLAAIEGSGTLGVTLGLVGAVLGPDWLILLGLAAALGLVGFFIIATGAHAAKRVFHNIGFPITFLLLACCAAVYFARVADVIVV